MIDLIRYMNIYTYSVKVVSLLFQCGWRENLHTGFEICEVFVQPIRLSSMHLQ